MLRHHAIAAALLAVTLAAPAHAQDNPLGLAVGAAAVGFLAGLLVPVTQVENEKIGPMAPRNR